MLYPLQSATEPTAGALEGRDEHDEDTNDEDEEEEEEEKSSSAKKLWRFLITWVAASAVV